MKASMARFLKKLISWVGRNKKGLIIAAIVVVGGTYGSYWGFYAATSSPSFCTACHFMKPFYEQWQTSTHNQVTCIACHPNRVSIIAVATIKYLSNNYNPRPRAEVKDESCLQAGCHQERLKLGKISFKKGITFDHNEHIARLRREKQLRCTSCHSQIIQGDHVTASEKVCFLCHFKGAAVGESVTGCPSCHGTPQRIVEHEGFYFSHESYLKIGVACNQCHIEVASGAGDVPKSKCFACHVQRVERYDDSKFIHDNHVTQRNLTCFQCHSEIDHGRVKMIRAFEIKCENCHQRKHTAQKELYMGTGAMGVADTPSRMFAAQVSCDGCHRDEAGLKRPPGAAPLRSYRQKMEAQRQACVSCHGKGYDELLDRWVEVSKEVLDAFKPIAQEAGKAMAKIEAGEGRYPEAEELLKDVLANYEFLIRGKPAHNVEYAFKTVRASADQLDVAMKYIDKGYKPAPKGELIESPDAYCTALCHGKLGLKDSIKLADMTIPFPHTTHFKDIGIGCTLCHSPEKHKMRVISKSECMNCHHTQKDIQCGTCHVAQQELFAGTAKGLGVAEAKPSLKAGAFDCQLCHELDKKEPIVTSVREKCISCHSEEYGDKLVSWEQQGLKELDAVTLRLDDVNDKVSKAKKRGQDVAQAEELLDEARRNYELVERGKSVHNVELSSALLKASLKLLNDAAEALKKSETAPGATSR